MNLSTRIALSVAVLATLVTLPYPGQPVGQAANNGTFSEDFSMTTYKDGSETNADWDTSQGELVLPTAAGDWYQADGTTPGEDNVSNMAGLSQGESLALDSNGQPGIAWNDDADGDNDIYFAQWDGSAWVGADGVAGSDNITANGVPSVSPDVAFSSSDVPYVAYSDDTPGTTNVFVARWTGTTWDGLDGVAGPDNVSNGGTGDQLPQLVLDSDDRPVVIWHDGGDTSDPIRVTRWNGSAWVQPDGTTPGHQGVPASTASAAIDHIGLALDSADRPAVAWTDFVLLVREAMYSAWNGSAWVMADGTTVGADNVSSDATDSLGPNLARKSNGRPVMVWRDGFAPAEIFYAEWNGSAWVQADGTTPAPENLSNTGPGDSQEPSLVVDSADRAHVSYGDDAAGDLDLMYQQWNGSAWTAADGTTAGPESVIATTANSFLPSLAVDAFDDPAIALVDDTNGAMTTFEILFTRWIEPHPSPRVAQSLTVDNTDNPILTATLTASTTVPSGTSVTFELSNDGGTTFEPATSGTPVTFTSEASDLRWRAVLTSSTGYPSVSPSVDDLAIVYATSVTRIPGDTLREQAINISENRFATAGSAPSAFLCRDDIPVDCFVAAPLVNQEDATLLVTNRSALESDVLAELNRSLGASSGKLVTLLGGDQALSSAVEASVQAAGFTTRRIAGPERNATAADVANHIAANNPAPSTRVFVSENREFADAFSVGAIASVITDSVADAILLTERGRSTLDASSAAYLAGHPEVTSIELIGGTAALPSGVQSAMASQFPGKTITRSAGANRFATGVEVAKRFVSGPEEVVVANGEAANLSSALSVRSSAGIFSAMLAGAFAGTHNAPLLLTRVDALPTEVENYILDNADTLTHAFIVGSTGQVSTAVEHQLVGSL